MGEATYYLPKELAAAAKVTPQCIRVWEHRGLIPPAERTPGGHRRYTQVHLDQIRQLAAARTASAQPVPG